MSVFAQGSPGRAEITVDLAAIRSNISRLAGIMPGVAQMAVVKANAYGHGAVPVARAAREAGAAWLGVALPAEAVQLREAGDSGRILAWLMVPGDDDIATCVGLDVDLSASAPWAVDEIADAAAALGRRARVHLKIDTGLGRSGCMPGDWEHLLTHALSRPEHIEIVGLWSHLSLAGSPGHAATDSQIAVFDDACATAVAMGVSAEVRHLASSGAAITRPDTRYDLVRLGIAIYGLSPGGEIAPPWPDGLDLDPAMTVRARIASVKRVPAGHGVAYGLTWQAPAETGLALVPVGYADGIPRSVQGSSVSVGDVRYTVVGKVAMDQFVIDVGDAAVTPGDEVVLLGDGRRGEPTAQEWAPGDDTIVYEAATRMGARIPRRFLD